MIKESPSEYIGKHVEEIDTDRLEAAMNALSKPLGEVEYHKEDHVTIENDPFVLEFDYGTAVDEFPEVTKDGKTLNSADLRELNSFQLARQDRNVALGLKDIVPKDCKIFFAPNDLDKSWSSFAAGDKTIVLNGDITKPEMILHLLHEAGHIDEHAQEHKNEFASEKNMSRKTIGVHDLADKLASERNAWSYALKKLRPLLDRGGTKGFPINEEDVKTIMKSLALRSYNESILNDVNKRNLMHHSALDMMDDWPE